MSKKILFKIPSFSKNKINEFKKKFKSMIQQNQNNPQIDLIRSNKAYPPIVEELYFLFNFVKINKRLTILEFGSGWSSLFFSIALFENKKKYFEYCKNNLRNSNLFELFILENEKKYFNISKKRIEKFHNNREIKINYQLSDVIMTNFQGRYSHEYEKLPLCNPDLIYLDGPDQFKIKTKKNSFNINHKDLMPMSSDILKIEFFLQPGTIIIIDGRGANFQFLKTFLKRKWIYKYISQVDKHIMYLDAPSLGKLNTNRLKFYHRK